MSEGDLARARRAPAAEEAGAARRVMGRAEGARLESAARAPSAHAPSSPRRPAAPWMRVTSSASSNASAGRSPAQAAREHRLAGARRAAQQQRVPAGGRELERALGGLLAAHVGEVGAVVESARGRERRRHPREPLARPRSAPSTSRRCVGGVHLEPRRERGLARRSPPARRGARSRRRARRAPGRARRARGAGGRRGRARRRGRAPSSAPASTRAGGGEDRRPRSARSSPGPLLRTPAGARFTVTRRSGKRSPAEADGRAHAGRGLAHGRLGQPHHVDAGQLRADPDLDLDGARRRRRAAWRW